VVAVEFLLTQLVDLDKMEVLVEVELGLIHYQGDQEHQVKVIMEEQVFMSVQHMVQGVVEALVRLVLMVLLALAVTEVQAQLLLLLVHLLLMLAAVAVEL
jgi:hypothetical protein